jgi:hypothetical protein
MELRDELHSKENPHRMDKSKNFNKGDIVFAVDRYNIPGNSRPLKTTFLPSPYVVIESYYTTTLIERIADKFRTLISNDDIKKYEINMPDTIIDLPVEVKNILLSPYEDMLPEDINIITEKDTLSIPPGIPDGGEIETKQTKIKNSSSLKRGQAPSLPENGSPQQNFFDDDDFDDWIIFKDDATTKDVTNDENIQQAFNQERAQDEEIATEEPRDEEQEEDNEDLTLRSGKRVRFAK